MLPGPLERLKGKKSRRIPFPATPKLRIAQIGRGPLFDGVAFIAAGHWQQIATLRPNVLVGPAVDLQAIAATDVRIDVASIDHAIFVLTGPGDTPVTDVLRVILWQKFGVPVYELLLDESGQLCAAECEAHNGLHLQAGTTAVIAGRELVLSLRRGRKLHTGFCAVLDSSECPCGMPGLRIAELAVQIPFALRQLAISA